MANTQIHMDQEAARRAREHGWTEQTKYDYSTLGGKSNVSPDAIAAPLWAANAKRYEWDDEFGDIGPAHDELEKELFGREHAVKKGGDYEQ